jgi:phytoene dehydrogenase-like protein
LSQKADILSGPSLPRELPGLDGFYMIGQWVEPGGGLPPVALSGRNVAQVICQRDGKPFHTTQA